MTETSPAPRSKKSAETDPVPISKQAAMVDHPSASRRTPLSVHAALLLTQAAAGSLAVEGKLAMGRFGISPPALAMMRLLGGALVFVTAHRVLRAPHVTSARDRLALCALSI